MNTQPENAVAAEKSEVLTHRQSHLAKIVLVAILGVYVALETLMPLRTAVKIGADEDFELCKVTLCLKGYQLYREVWNDQPPLETFLLTKMFTLFSPSILGARLFTVSFSILLLASTFLIAQRRGGVLAAAVASCMLLASPGFLELSSSCMQEIPALAPAVAGLCLLWRASFGMRSVILSGILFAFGLEIKFIEAIYLPIAGLVLWLRGRENGSTGRETLKGCLIFGGTVVLGCLLFNALTGNPLLVQLKQSWAAHFASTRSFEYGSPADRPFDWAVLLRNWETTIPALVGIGYFCRRLGSARDGILPLAWLVLTLIVFSVHEPWWAYYYIHNSVPLCICAAFGIANCLRLVNSRRNWGLTTCFGMFTVCVIAWMGARVYFEEASVRSSPRVYSSLVLKELQRFKPYVKFMFSEQPIYSFHAQIPMPPHLAVISLKRFWSGDLSNAGLASELQTAAPELILLDNNGQAVPYQALLERKYRLIYQDRANRLYASQTLLKASGYYTISRR